MGQTLILSEKPSQSKKIAEAYEYKVHKDHLEIMPCDTFRNGAIVVNFLGHLVESYYPEDYSADLKEWRVEDLPIIPKVFKLKPIPSKSAQFNMVKKWINNPTISTIISASDPETEGVLLITEVLYLLGNKKPVKVFWSTSLTKSSVRKAFNQLRDHRELIPMYYSGLARQHSDWIIGLNLSRLMSIELSKKGINKSVGIDSRFSVGRVQSALLSIINKREKDIELFKVEPYWDVECYFDSEGQKFKGTWFKEDEVHLFDKDLAEHLAMFCQKGEARIYSIKREDKELPPPQFHNLTSLQVAVNNLTGLSPTQVLKVAQELYQRSLISYPRSQPKHVTPEEAKLFPKILENLSTLEEYRDLIPAKVNDISLNKRFVDESKTDDHYAIILTEEVVDLNTLTKHERIVYDLIAKSMIAAHYSNAVYSNTEIITTVAGVFTFKTTGKEMKDPGWQVIYDTIREASFNIDTLNPKILQEQQIVTISSIEIIDGHTTAPKRFNQANLTSIMENAGAYLTESEKEGFKNKELAIGTIATRSGIIDQLINKSYIRIEKNLVFIEVKGKILMEALKGIPYLTSPVTTGNMDKFLSEISNGKGDYKRDYKRFVKRSQEITEETIDKVMEQSENWDFSNLITQHQEDKKIGQCKLCSGAVIDKGEFYGCDQYHISGCDFKLSKRVSGKDISVNQIIKLIETGSSSLIRGFKKSKKEGTFDAFLTWDENSRKIRFTFEGLHMTGK